MMDRLYAGLTHLYPTNHFTHISPLNVSNRKALGCTALMFLVVVVVMVVLLHPDIFAVTCLMGESYKQNPAPHEKGKSSVYHVQGTVEICS